MIEGYREEGCGIRPSRAGLRLRRAQPFQAFESLREPNHRLALFPNFWRADFDDHDDGSARSTAEK